MAISKAFLLRLYLGAGLLFLAVACSGVLPTSSEYPIPVGAFLTADDLPAGWYQVKGIALDPDIQDVVIGVARYAGSRNPSQSWLSVLQQITVYPDEDKTLAAYDYWLGK